MKKINNFVRDFRQQNSYSFDQVCDVQYSTLSIQHHVIKFVSDLRQVNGFLRVPWFPPSVKLTVTI